MLGFSSWGCFSCGPDALTLPRENLAAGEIEHVAISVPSDTQLTKRMSRGPAHQGTAKRIAPASLE